MPISVKVPSSIKSARRSRAVSFSAACCFAIFSSPPPSAIWARRACRSSTSGRKSEVFSWVLIYALSRSVAFASAALPLRLALLEEGGDALDDVLGGHRQRELGSEVVKRVVERHVELAAHGLLAKAHDHRRLPGQLLSPGAHGGVQL